MARSRKKESESWSEWAAAAETRSSLEWHLDSIQELARNLVDDPKGIRACRTLWQVAACRDALQRGDAAAAANAAFEASAAFHHATYAVKWLEDSHRGKKTAQHAARIASAGGHGRAEKIQKRDAQVIEWAKNSKKPPGTTLAALARELAPRAKLSQRQIERILSRHREHVLS